MSSEKMKLGVAAAIFLAGGGVLVNGYLNFRPPEIHNHVEHEVSQEVLDTLDTTRFVELLEDGQSESIDLIQSAIVKQVQQIPRVHKLGDQSVDDLAQAFVERVSGMYWPDFERDFQASRDRGDPTPEDLARVAFDKNESFHESFDWKPMVDFDGVDVSLIQIGPDEELNIERERFDAGFGVVVGKRSMNAFPLPENPVGNGFVCVEIVMPMYLYEVKSESLKPAVAGYHFAWNAKMGKWVPYESVLFNAPGMIFGVPII